MQPKVFLEFFNVKKKTMTCFSPKFGEKPVIGFLKFNLIALRLENPKLGPFLEYPALHFNIANPPKSLTSAFFAFICQFIHNMTHIKYQKYVFGLKSSNLKIGANGAGAYTIPQSVS